MSLTKSGNGRVRVNGTLRTLSWSGSFTSGSTVTVEAVPDSGWNFSSWSGDLSGSTNPTTITMNGDKNITANFTQDVIILSYSDYWVDDDNSGNSVGNNDGAIDPGETIELFVTLQNTGSGDATGVTAELSTSDSYVGGFNNTSSGYPGIPAGGAGENTDDWDFAVDPGCPPGHVITFDLVITSNEGSWTDSFEVVVGVSAAISDYDGDGKTDIAIYRSSNGGWWIIPSSTGSPYGVGWGGVSGDIAVPGDFDGDGKTGIAIYRSSNGAWYIIPSSGGSPYGVGWGGTSGDIPVPGDYDGDGKADVAIYRSTNGGWYIVPSSSGSPYGVGWGGLSGDMPVNPTVIHLYRGLKGPSALGGVIFIEGLVKSNAT